MPIQVTLQQLLLRCREVVTKKYGKLCFKFCPSLTVTGGESMRTQVTHYNYSCCSDVGRLPLKNKGNLVLNLKWLNYPS